ncbi:hypothetical protein CVT24_010810 [Panaeolus cyanescens]|uniref:Uncharacterized protein n=1 Tax=Panaeolus cyanescens TaxID=181874 RepID=A0A409VGX3_9AGAR|nr:hypothetical protein CVT24_010810 [Panaeolus cyanescens]
MVNRKQPNAPAAMSRSSSSQPVATTSTTRKAQPSQLKKQYSNGSANGGSTSKSKQSQKKRHGETKKSGSFTDKLFFLFLSAFVAYTFVSCRPNPLFPTPSSTPPSALCRSLHSYNVNVLEPYVIPPVIKTWEYTQPYLDELKSHADPYLEPIHDKVAVVRPYAASAYNAVVTTFQSYIRPFSRSVIQHWKISVVPRYRRHIHPRLQPAVQCTQRSFDKYVTVPVWNALDVLQNKVEVLYLRHLEPHVACLRPYIQDAWRKTHHVLHSLNHTYQTQVHPVLLHVWAQARPHLCTLWKTSKVVASKAFSQTTLVTKKAVKEGAVLRRQYVDPHLGKIWDKVSASPSSDEGFSSANIQVDSDPIPTVASEPEPTPSSKPDDFTVSVAATPVNAYSAEDTKLANPSIPTPEEDVLDEIPTPESTPVYNEHEREEAQHAVSIAEESAAGASTVVYELEREAEKVGATAPPHGQPSVTPELDKPVAPQPSLTDAPAPTPEVEVPVLEEEQTVEEPVTPAPSPSSVPTQDEEDIDDFLRELGVSDETSSRSVTQSTSSEAVKSTPTVSEEDIAAAKESTKAKRANITARHKKWFDKLQEMVPETARKLVDKLNASRLKSVEQVKQMMNGGNKEEGKLDNVAKEGEKLIRGLEAYLKKAVSRRSAWAPLPKDESQDPTTEEIEKFQSIANAEKNKWTNVVSKVDEKFSTKVRNLENEVYDWYTKVREAESADVTASALEIKAIADKAQGDIGLDYAWLEDVTYRDWQKYHDLMRVYENYTQVAYQLQNGTEVSVSFSNFPVPLDLPSTPADPLVPVLDQLYSELQDIVLGFNIALNNVRVKALKVFSLRPKIALDENGEVTGASADDDDGFFVVKDGQRRRDDLRGVDLEGLKIATPKGSGKLDTAEDEKEEQVVILPIGDGEERKSDDEFDPSTIIVGKDKVQVQEALKDVPVEPAASRHEEL